MGIERIEEGENSLEEAAGAEILSAEPSSDASDANDDSSASNDDSEE